MDKKIEETREFLQTIGMPKAQQADICCYVILAMAGIKPDMSWSEATNEWIRIHDIIQFVNTFYGMSYAENSRETFRKQALHRFRTAALIEDNGKATNSPNYRYRLTEETVKINTLLSNGFIINHIVEPQPPEYMMDIPGMRDEMRRPMMLIVSANKKVDR